MRDFFVNCLSTVVYSIVRAVRPEVQCSYAQEGEDLVLNRLFEGQRHGFYVDVGAHHPFRFSNTYLLSRRGWRGINIDPNPEAMRLFGQWRRRDVNLMIGIAEECGSLRFFQFNESALNTFDEQLARDREVRDGYQLIASTLIPVQPLRQVFEQHLPKGQVIDVLSVDAEGVDLNVIRSNDWDRFRPYCVLVESLQSSLTALETNPMHRYVSEHGYGLFAKTVNTFIYLDQKNPR
ncbi:MAG: FkbM family methyltransferase [Nitrospira sp.]|jgi:FkbM family methyltransferase|nr:FkbM family methyltransferase [Nitrospira sp.]HQY58608.1 FkbM family methyltransferase [Nitrospira sp.]HRA95484.1 FkbM family methyltransferase [Nitrospira sp.]